MPSAWIAHGAALDRTRCVKCSVLAGTPAYVHGRRQLTALGTAGSPTRASSEHLLAQGKSEARTTRAARVVGTGPQQEGSASIRNSSAARRDNPERRLA